MERFESSHAAMAILKFFLCPALSLHLFSPSRTIDSISYVCDLSSWSGIVCFLGLLTISLFQHRL